MKLIEHDATVLRRVEGDLAAGVRSATQDIKHMLDLLRQFWYQQESQEAQKALGVHRVAHADAVHYENLPSIVTQQAFDIVDRILPETLSLFLRKNRNYAEVDNSLGAKGIFPDINRKTGMLKRALWLDELMYDESTREIAMDLIGHLLLAIHMLDATAAATPTKWSSVASGTGKPTIAESDGSANDGGWNALPDDIKLALTRMARGSMLSPALRGKVREYVESRPEGDDVEPDA